MAKKSRNLFLMLLSIILIFSVGSACANKQGPAVVGVPPTVVSVPTEKTVEVGTYTDFQSDLSAIVITDDNVEKLPYATKKVVAISIGDQVEENADGIDKYFLDKVGEYSVKVEIKDVDGNKVYADYKINTVDTVSPVVTLGDMIYVWENNGKVVLPVPSVDDFSSFSTEVIVKKDLNNVEVANNCINAQVGDLFTAKYSIKDAFDNVTEKETILKVIPNGKLVDINDADLLKAITVKEGVIETDGALSYYYDGRTDVIEWRNGYYSLSQSQFNALSISVENNKSSSVEIAVFAKVDGTKVAVGNIDLLPANEQSQVAQYILDISALKNQKIDGWRFELNSLANMRFEITDLSFVNKSDIDNQPEQTDGSLIGFELSSNFEFKSKYNGGITENTNTAFVSNGNKSAQVNLKANQSAGVLFKNKVNLANDANYVSLNAYSLLNGAVRIGFVIDGVEYISSEIELDYSKVNKIGFFIDPVALTNFKDKSIEGIFVYNQEKYENIIYIDCICVDNKLSIEREEVFRLDTEDYTVDKAEKFIVPDIVNCDMRIIKSVSVINTLGIVNLDEYTLGEEVDISGFDSGDYLLTYNVTDIFDKTHTFALNLHINAGSLVSTVTFSNYYTNQQIIFPNPTLSSEVFGQTELDNASIKKYYRIEGQSEWILIDESVVFEQPTYIDVKYVVTVGEYKVSTLKNMYIHSDGVVMDYEKHIKGDYLGFRGQMYNSGINKPKISTRWSKDGKYSLYVQHFTGWDDYNGVWETRYTLSEYVDTVVFYAYSDWDLKPAKMYFDDYSGVSVSGDVEIMPGEHKYVVRLSKPIKHFDRWWIDVDKMHGFYIDNIYMYNSANYEYPEIDGKYYSVSDGGIAFEKPKVTNVNTKVFSAQEIANVKYYIDVTNLSTTIKKTYAIEGDSVQLALAKGEYSVKFRVVIGQTEYFDIQQITVGDLTYSFFKPLTSIYANTEYKFKAPEVNGQASVEAFIKSENGNWTAVEIVENYAVINLSESGKYHIKFTVDNDLVQNERIYDFTVRANNLIADFELDEEGNYHGTYGRNSGTYGYVSDGWAKNGDYSYYFNTGNHAMYEWVPGKSIELGASYNALAVNAKVVRNPVYGCTNLGQKINGLEITVKAKIDGVEKSFTSKQVIMPNGEGRYIFVFDYNFDNISYFSFWVHYLWASSFYFDDITAERVDLPEFDAGSYIKVGQSLTIDGATSSVDGVKTQVSYGVEQSDKYTAVQENNGKFNITFNQNGDYVIITKVIVDGNVFITRTTKIAVRNFAVEFIEPIGTVNLNQKYTWQVYDQAENGTTVEVYLKKKSQAEWTKINLNADGKTFDFELVDFDEYQLKYQAKNGNNTETEVYTLQARKNNVLMDFELDENGNHYGAGKGDLTKLSGSCFITDEWAKDGKYSYFFGFKGISSIAFTYYDPAKFNKENGWIKDGYKDLGTSYNAITLSINAKRILYGHELAYDADGNPIYDANGYQDYVRGNGIKMRVELREADGSSRTIFSNAIIIPVGEGTYTFVFEESFKDVYSIGFGLHYWMTTDFYVDGLTLEKVEYPELPSMADIGDKITVSAVEFNENTTTSIKYRMNGGTYINLGLIKGSYEVEVLEYGVMEIVLEVKIGGNLVALKTFTVTVMNDPIADDIEWL